MSTAEKVVKTKKVAVKKATGEKKAVVKKAVKPKGEKKGGCMLRRACVCSTTSMQRTKGPQRPPGHCTHYLLVDRCPHPSATRAVPHSAVHTPCPPLLRTVKAVKAKTIKPKAAGVKKVVTKKPKATKVCDDNSL